MNKPLSHLRKTPYAFFISVLIILCSFTGRPVDLVKDVWTYTNEFRVKNGMKSLVLRDDLSAVARRHSEDMAKGRTGFGHAGFKTRNEKIKQLYGACTMAENVAYGASNGRHVVDIWKNSAGHRRNLLGDYKYIGIGIARDPSNRTYYTQILVR